MEITSGVLRVRFHLYDKIIKLEDKIVNYEKKLENTNENSEEYIDLTKRLNVSNENLRKQVKLYNFLGENKDLKFINLKKVVGHIVALEAASIVDIVECLCYVFNKNYQFFTDDSNVQYFIESNSKVPVEKSEKQFYENQRTYKILREYITEDNKVTQMKETSAEEFEKFKNVGFTKKAIGVLMDTALRNYEYAMIYQLKRELKI